MHPEPVKVALDVHYSGDRATAAAIAFIDWHTDAIAEQASVELAGVADYVPGDFRSRELPCLLAVLQALRCQPGLIIVDGHVWLGAARSPGLGAHLHDALDHQVPVIGVAKSPFRGAPPDDAVLRGASRRPLWVTAVGYAAATARENVQRMHGAHRIPTLLRVVDRLCRPARDC